MVLLTLLRVAPLIVMVVILSWSHKWESVLDVVGAGYGFVHKHFTFILRCIFSICGAISDDNVVH